jgi:hypothetical protein
MNFVTFAVSLCSLKGDNPDRLAENLCKSLQSKNMLHISIISLCLKIKYVILRHNFKIKKYEKDFFAIKCVIASITFSMQ